MAVLSVHKLNLVGIWAMAVLHSNRVWESELYSGTKDLKKGRELEARELNPVSYVAVSILR